MVERKNIKKLMINGELVIEWKKEYTMLCQYGCGFGEEKYILCIYKAREEAFLCKHERFERI